MKLYLIYLHRIKKKALIFMIFSKKVRITQKDCVLTS